jgi:hypothetical protein
VRRINFDTGQNLPNMPIISLQKAEKLVKPTGPFQTTNLSVRGYRAKVMFLGDSVEPCHLDLIISNAWKYQVLFFDTEEGLNTKTPALSSKFYSNQSKRFCRYTAYLLSLCQQRRK